MRVLVTGSRDWTDVAAVNDALDAISAHVDDDIVVVHGACRTGADAYARAWVQDRLDVGETTITEDPHPVDWSQGARGGPIRNHHMISLGADVCLAFIGLCTARRCRESGKRPEPHESHGASGTAAKAERAGIPTIRIYDDRVPVSARTGTADHHVARVAEMLGLARP
jgi:hypothetical protein